MSYMINRIPGTVISDLYSGSNKRYFDSVLSSTNDDIEAVSLANNRKVYKAVCLSGGQGVPTPSGTSNMGFINGVELVDLGDGVERYGIRFRISEGTFNSSDKHSFTSAIPNPFKPGLSESEKQRRINLHPMAFTEVGSKFERQFTFGTILNLKLMGKVWVIQQMLGNGSGIGAGSGAGAGAMSAFAAGMPFTADAIEGSEFTVAGVKFISVPAKNAGTRALTLWNSAEASGQVDGWDMTPEGRAWVVKNIYEVYMPGSGPEYGPLLGTDEESFWSSWFFRVAYLPYQDMKTPGLNPSKHDRSYAADDGYELRQKVLVAPADFKGKEVFLTFKPEEAPLYVGDAVFNWRDTASGQGFDHMLEPGGPAHMKIIASISPDGAGFKATLHDGNTSNKVGKSVFKLNANRTLHANHTSKYIAVYKKVKVV